MYGGGGMGMGMMPGMMGPDMEELKAATKDYEVRFYPYDETAESFLQLLRSTLPPYSTVTSDADLSVVAIYSDPQGQDKAQEFFNELEKTKSQRNERQVLLSGDRQSKGALLEILLLSGVSEGKGSAEPLSSEAKEMGLSLEDLKFLGDKYWPTYGKGLVRVSDGGEFETYISDCRVRGEIRAMGELHFSLVLAINWEEEISAGDKTQYRTYGFETAADVAFGQTTLLGTTGHGKDLLVVVRAIAGKVGGDDTGIPLQILK